jgi:hypothetical protein
MAQQENSKNLSLSAKVLIFLAVVTSALSAVDNVGKFGFLRFDLAIWLATKLRTEMSGAIATSILFDYRAARAPRSGTTITG